MTSTQLRPTPTPPESKAQCFWLRCYVCKDFFVSDNGNHFCSECQDWIRRENLILLGDVFC